MTTARHSFWSYLHNLNSIELNEHSEKAIQPPSIKQKLLPHQLTSIAKALQLEESKTTGIECNSTFDSSSTVSTNAKLYSSYGILCDRVGSGKSLTALALASYPSPSPKYTEFMNRNNSGSSSDISLIKESDIMIKPDGTSYRKINASLFIVPHAIVHQWEDYLTKQTTLRHIVLKRAKDASIPISLKIDDIDVVVVSSTMWKKFEEANSLADYVWNRVFVDEADSIHFNTYGDLMYVKACFYWLISASWMNFAFPNGMYVNISVSYPPPEIIPTSTVEKVKKYLMNSSHTLYIDGLKKQNFVRSLCGYNNFSYLYMNNVVLQSYRLFVKNSDNFIEHSFAFPDINHYSIVCETPASILSVDKSLSPEILEHLHAGDLEGAFEMLGVKPQSVTTINEALTQSLHKELDQAIKIYEFKKTLEYSSEDAKYKSLDSCEKKIASLQSRISAIDDRLKTSSDSNCPICFSNITNPSLTPCCQNLFCFPCICESLTRSTTCPLCRAAIKDVKSIHIVGESIKESTKDEIISEKPKKLSKNESLIEFIKHNPTAKILMFSGFDATFDTLSTLLKKENINFANVQGSNAHINKLITGFENDKYKILFLNARNMGAGLNILSASHVVMYHKMNASLENQIIGRAYRIGRTEPLQVIHLLHTNEIDKSYSVIEASSTISNPTMIEHV
jgi:hypothetical protein